MPQQRPSGVSRFDALACFVLFGMGVVILMLEAAHPIDRMIFDWNTHILRRLRVGEVSPSVVVIGVDDASVRALPEPTALWHRHLAAFLDAASQARARAVGLDLILPGRSYAGLMPRSDEALVKSLLRAGRTTVLGVAATVDEAGTPRPIHTPFLAAIGEKGMGFALWPVDGDGIIRQLRGSVGEGDSAAPTLYAVLAKQLGVTPISGWIDYTRGAAYDYVPLATVLKWHADGEVERLADLMQGQIVLLGAILPFEDRHLAPVALAAWEPGEKRVPGVLLLAQSIRTYMASTTMVPAADWMPIVSVLGAALTWLARRRRSMLMAGGAIVACLPMSFVMLHQGVNFPLASAMLTGVAGLLARIGLSARASLSERKKLKDAFAKYASEPVLRQMLAGGFKKEGERRFVCALFTDIRGYTTRSEATDPAQIMATLNRFFEAVIPAIHERNGMVVEFTGDGLYALFGAPQDLDNPCQTAFDAAKDFIARVDKLNVELINGGDDPIRVGIGVHCGEVVVGLVGAIARSRYTATGDTVNVAARIEGLTKELGYPLLVSRSVAERLSGLADLTDLGTQVIRGRAPISVLGWPTRSKRESQ